MRTAGSRKARGCAMWKPRVASGNCSVERSLLHGQSWEMWIGFVRALAARLSKRTVADTCSSLRAFLRFLHMTGRLPTDLAGGVIAPRYRIDERPPRCLPWSDVQKILRGISRTAAPGKRDYAIVLLLATYGLGAAEVLGIRLEDVDWQGGVLRVCRPKTKVSIELPLLPAVAQALSAYLRWERPPARSVPHIFLRENMPYEPITSAHSPPYSVLRGSGRHFNQSDRSPCFSAQSHEQTD
jgi:integrase